MYLKFLEMNGFKSFADRTRLEFHPGVTGIVGPNGCGKSNVVDAIRWVLGETSAKALRGEEMADVIFNGTESRKPLGMAEVSLTLSGCEGVLPVEYHEVCVGRRVYRDGRSEYLLNRTPCRLRDIHDLFVDTGIGRACYSIMQQGKIDQLLSSKPEDRRLVFEEAAGITKYKQQKRESLRRLEATEANLLRITDVLEEQQRQMASLQRQAAKARRYAALLHHVRVLDGHGCHRQYQSLLQEREAASLSLTAVRRAQEETQRALSSLQASLSRDRASHQELEAQFRDSLQTLSAQAARIDSAEKHVAFNEERIQEWTARIERHQEEITVLESRLAQEKSQLTAADDELHRRASALSSREEALSAAVQALSGQRLRRAAQETLLRETQQQLATCEGNLGSLQVQIEGLHAQLASLAQRRETLETSLSAAGAALAEKSSEAARLSLQAEAASAALEDRAAALAGKEAVLAAQEDAHRRAMAGLQEQGRLLASQQARLEMLRQLGASGEGLEEGTRQVLAGLDQPERFSPSIHGPLVSTFQVDDETLAAAEAALGPALQAVLVADAPSAASIVAALRERKLGQAALVVPESAPPPAPPPPPDGSLGWLAERIEPSGPGASGAVLERLLSGVALAPDLETALRLRQGHPSLAFATLQGDFISAAGVISGGFRDPQAGSPLRLQREIRRLVRLTRDLAARCDTLQDESRREAQLLESARAAAASLRASLQEARLEAATLDSQANLARRERDQMEAAHQQLGAERSALDGLEGSHHRQLISLEEKLRLAREERDRLQASLPSLDSGLAQLRQLEEQAAEDTARLRTELAVEQQSAETLRRQLGPLHSRLRDLELSLRQRQEETSAHRERIQAASAESDQLREEMARSREVVLALHASQEELEQRRGRLAAVLAESDSQLAALRQDESRLTQEAGAWEVRMTQLDLRLENLTSQVSQRYQLDLASFAPDLPSLLASIAELRPASSSSRNPLTGPSVEPAGSPESPMLVPETEPDWRFVEEQLPELRRKLDSLGSVNLDAIAEFEELEERFRLVQSQHEDLTRARDELHKIIARINRTTREQFTQTFAQVAANFRAMFAELFGKGSTADLLLLDEQDPLECGIEIIAKPPGKKLQSISLLSGGERSMTAVALLFAIYMVKPSPFCVLDELDAPLDEANIERFCRVLDRFCGQSQFIIVTHSKRTMHRADVMYGVSMEERGVSKTLSVQLAPAAAA